MSKGPASNAVVSILAKPCAAPKGFSTKPLILQGTLVQLRHKPENSSRAPKKTVIRRSAADREPGKSGAYAPK
jgi:hypothetical protein